MPGVAGLSEWSEYRNARVTFGEASVVVARISQLGVPGFCLFVERNREAELRRALESAGAVPVEQDAINAVRLEAAYPLFEVDMTDDTIPLEAGIENRAISLTKGCYVGQEVIIRVLHRGHGRVARRLVSMAIKGTATPERRARIFSGERDIGFLTSAAMSPRLGLIALGYVHRDFVGPDTPLAIDTPAGRVEARVTQVQPPAVQ
jgi:folate-binding protein YgfZ